MPVSCKENDKNSEEILELTVKLPQAAWDTLMRFRKRTGLTTSEAITQALNSFYDYGTASHMESEQLLLLDSRIERLEDSWRAIEARIRVIEMKKNPALPLRNKF